MSFPDYVILSAFLGSMNTYYFDLLKSNVKLDRESGNGKNWSSVQEDCTQGALIIF